MKKSLGDRITDAVVDADDIKTALMAINNLEPGYRSDYTAVTMSILRAFGMLQGPDSDNSQDEPISEEKLNKISLVTAVQIRIEAVGSIANDPKFKAWSIEVCNDNEDYILMREDVLHAIAKTPLKEDKNAKDRKTFFDADEFFECLLSVSEKSGTA